MTQSAETLNHPPSDIDLDYDAIVIGAGISGLYQLFKLREIGMKVCVFEMAGFRGLLYTLAKLMGDYNAVKKGKVGKRVGRRVAGKATGKAMRKLFK